jgi:hypothetical protein
MREKMKKENPKIVMVEFMKMVSMEWTRMSQEEKNRYERLVQTDRARYKRNLPNSSGTSTLTMSGRLVRPIVAAI